MVGYSVSQSSRNGASPWNCLTRNNDNEQTRQFAFAERVRGGFPALSSNRVNNALAFGQEGNTQRQSLFQET